MLRDRSGGAKVGRRSMLRYVGGGGAAVAAAGTAVGAALPAHGESKPAGNGPPANVKSSTPQRLRRWVMVIDLRKCDGCVSTGKPPQCTEACIKGRTVPVGMEWIQVYQQPLPGGGTQFVPTPCMQCQNAPCVNVCPVGATFATPEGAVLIDQQRCIGCRLCMAACPYERRFFNWGNPVIPKEALFADYTVESQIPAKRGTVMKCDFCAERPRQGNLPYCMQACPGKALYYGDEEEDIATNGQEVVKLSRFLSEHQAYRMKDELGTKPSVYYVPGHGEERGRQAMDPRQPLPAEWPWAAPGQVEQARTAVRATPTAQPGGKPTAVPTPPPRAATPAAATATRGGPAR